MRTLIALVLVTVLALPAAAQQLLSMPPTAPGPVPGVPGGAWTVSGRISVGLLTLRLPPGAWLPAGIGERVIAAGKIGQHIDFAEKTFLQIEHGRVAAMLTLYAAKWPDWAGRWDDPRETNCALDLTGVYYESSRRMAPGREPKHDCLFVRVFLASPDYVGLNDTVKREGYAAAMAHGGVPKVFVAAMYDVMTPSAVALVEMHFNPELAGLVDWGGIPNRFSGAIPLDHLDAARTAYLDKVVRWAKAWRPELAAGLR